MPCLRGRRSDAATESSLAENAVRIAMHPADQVVGVQQARRARARRPSRSPPGSASSARTVQKRVRLGGLRRRGHRRLPRGPHQRGHRRGVRGHRRHRLPAQHLQGARRVRPALRPRRAPGHRPAPARAPTRPAALFVGLDAYRAAGGGPRRTRSSRTTMSRSSTRTSWRSSPSQKLNAVAARGTPTTGSGPRRRPSSPGSTSRTT